MVYLDILKYTNLLALINCYLHVKLDSFDLLKKTSGYLQNCLYIINSDNTLLNE